MATPSAAPPTAASAATPGPGNFLERSRRSLAQPVVAAFLAGGVAGAVSRTVVSPLERLKILFQVQSAGRTEYQGSVLRGLVKIWQEEGWRGMLRGNGTNCVRIVPYSAVQFGSYNLFKHVRLPLPLWAVDSGPLWTSRFGRGSWLTRAVLVHRAVAGRRSRRAPPPGLRRRRRHHLRHLHLPARHRAHAPIDPVRVLCEPGPGREQAAAGHVGDHGPHVQERRRLPGPVSGHHTHRRRRRALRACPRGPTDVRRAADGEARSG